MRTASILLALVVVFFASEGLARMKTPVHDFTVHLGQYSLGLCEYEDESLIERKILYENEGLQLPDLLRTYTLLCLGPFGVHQVPFTATQGLVGFCCILATLIILPAVLTVRWKKKQAA
jgi:hypothetical protein